MADTIKNNEGYSFVEWLDLVDETLYRRLGKVSKAFHGRYDFKGMFEHNSTVENCVESVTECELMGHD